MPEHRRLATVELLLDRGADLWLINHNGLTPRQMATEKNMPLSMLQKMADIEHSQVRKISSIALESYIFMQGRI